MPTTCCGSEGKNILVHGLLDHVHCSLFIIEEVCGALDVWVEVFKGLEQTSSFVSVLGQESSTLRARMGNDDNGMLISGKLT